MAGANYGWPLTRRANRRPAIYVATLRVPHDSGRCAIVGGAFYPLLSPQFPDQYAGDYFFGDLCAGWIGHYDFATGSASLDFATGPACWSISRSLPKVVSTISNVAMACWFESITSAMASRQSTRFRQLTRCRQSSMLTPPVIEQAPMSQTISVGQSVTFSVRAFGETPLGYQWRRNDADIPGATRRAIPGHGHDGRQWRTLQCSCVEREGELLPAPPRPSPSRCFRKATEEQ